MNLGIYNKNLKKKHSPTGLLWFFFPVKSISISWDSAWKNKVETSSLTYKQATSAVH